MTGSSPAGRLARALCAWLPALGLLARPDRPLGLTAIVRVRDEEEWLEPSIRSIAVVADQILVGDNGSRDRTPEILRRLVGDLGERLAVLALPELDIATLTNALLEQVRYRWVFRWDADFVAHTDGPRDIRGFREWLLSRDPRRFFMVYPRMVELAGDLFHQDPASPTRSDAHCFVGSPSLSYVYDRAGYEAPRVPRWYAVERFETPCFVHVNVKSDERLYRSALWKLWLVEGGRTAGEPFAHYTRRVTDASAETFRLAAREWALAYCRRLRPVDPTLLPRYPALLVPHVTQPTYRLIYRNGVVVGRQGPEAQRT
jgi:glycosyltransferase involved in cell wall biosynthesis